MMEVKVMIVDDQQMVRRGLRMSLNLEPGLLVVAEASDGLEALVIARQVRPDVIIMDVEMPVMDGIEAARLLAALETPPAVIFLSLHDHYEIRERALAAGAEAFVAKHAPPEILIDAIRSVSDGISSPESIAREANDG